MNENLKFLFLILGLTSILLALSIVLVGRFGSSPMVRGVFYGYLVSLFNILFAFFSIKWAFNRPNKTFFSTVLGGMGIRLVILFSALFLVRGLQHVHLIAFTISMIGFYLTLQVFEIRYIQNILSNRKVMS